MKIRGTNKLTGQRREIKVTLRSLERATFDGLDKCIGPCKCTVETDGTCPKGWPARVEAALCGDTRCG